MGAVAYSLGIEMVHETCCNCGVHFGMPSSMNTRLRTSGGSFYCPNGHQQHYTETENKRLQKQLEQEKKRREWAESDRDGVRSHSRNLEKSNAALRGVVTRTKNRVGHGVCPCCTRSFQNLRRHMANKHPQYIEGKSSK